MLSTQEIIESMKRWSASFSEATSQKICSLYDEQATLWGTLSPIKRDSPALIKDYFDQLFKYKNRYVELTESNIRFFSNIAICNGLYTFNWLDNDTKATKSARFSFVFINKNGQWFIIEHHSSSIPALP